MTARPTPPRIVLVNRSIIQHANGMYLLVKRADNGQYNGGLWEFPGGKLEMGQDLRNALEREVLEETGLLIESSSQLISAESYVIDKGKYKGFPYVLLFTLTKLIGGEIKLSDEHSAYAWELPDKAFDYELTQETRKALIMLTNLPS